MVIDLGCLEDLSTRFDASAWKMPIESKSTPVIAFRKAVTGADYRAVTSLKNVPGYPDNFVRVTRNSVIIRFKLTKYQPIPEKHLRLTSGR